MASNITYPFGFIPMDVRADLPRGSIEAVEGLQELIGKLCRLAHPDDGMIYAPETITATQNEAGDWERTAGTERTGLMHQLPPTHVLRLTVDDEADHKRGIAAFLIHFFGFLHGHRCQFADWFFDGSVPTKDQVDFILRSNRQLQSVMACGLEFWHKLGSVEQRVLTNALYLHMRAPTQRLIWERFVNEYMAFDAIYSVAVARGDVRDLGHGARMAQLSHAYGLCSDHTLESQMSQLRNDLLHQALWSGGMPGDAGSTESYYSALWIHNIASRAIFGLLGYRGPYVRSRYNDLQTRFLDLEERPAA